MWVKKTRRKKTKDYGITKYELAKRIIKEFVGLRPKTYSKLTDNNYESKTAKGTKQNVVKLKFQNSKNWKSWK